MSTTSISRRFCVQAATDSSACARLLQGVSFEDAALNFLEESHLADAEVQLFVEDCATGERHCFRIDLASGRSESCD